MERIVRSGEFYRHFKNKLYQIVTVAKHSETGEALVIYQALYGDFKTYARPLEMFLSEVDHEKYPEVTQKYRFERVEFEAAQMEPAAVPAHKGVEPAEEAGVNPDLLEFLDTESWDDRYNLLVSLRDKMTDDLIDSLAVCLDLVIEEGPLNKRYEELKNCVRTRQKYENQHLR